jgi:hypothetical protein
MEVRAMNKKYRGKITGVISTEVLRQDGQVVLRKPDGKLFVLSLGNLARSFSEYVEPKKVTVYHRLVRAKDKGYYASWAQLDGPFLPDAGSRGWTVIKDWETVVEDPNPVN